MRYLDHNPKTVWLIGMGPSWTGVCEPLMTQEANPGLYDEIWTVNMASHVLRSDLIIWMDDLREQENFRCGNIALLRRYGTPVLTSKSYPDILPNSYDYPLSEIMEKYALPNFGMPYMNNSVAQAIAYAMWKNVEILRVYGADFTYPNRDYAESGRACVESWITLSCALKSTQIQVAERSSLFDAVQSKGVYGYHKPPKITLSDGRVIEAPAMEGCNSPAYTPQEQNIEQLSAPVSGANGQSTPGERPTGTALHDSESPEPPATPRSGEGLWGGGEAERHQAGDPAGADRG